jgi:3-deoxy-manno-octulosonate cytidylyltransferase (CMP-KDO synthetase)
MRAVAIIPARLGASRFPEKLLAQIKGKSVLRRTYESAINTGLFDEVIVVADHDRLIAEIEAIGGRAVKSKKEYDSGTDRIAEVAAAMEADVFVNVQGDVPFIQKDPLEKLLSLFAGEAGKSVQVGSIVQILQKEEHVADPNYVKVALDLQQNALYFSRHPIPYPRDKDVAAVYYGHIGIYAFRKPALLRFTNLPLSPLEKAEKIECLRLLENGIAMKMAITEYKGVEIDAPADIARAEAFMAQMGLE